ncbi:hypothetical protein J437_LFUL006499 [Ladona fulva]|uniref:Uncharacterized protein n=1 Tax=Ladona fulva TaxID=123851 RepID=A0A8K0JZS7_LADFU|nr:hypothetical protein J437_LFUL006499 [Ladona fulva]
MEEVVMVTVCKSAECFRHVHLDFVDPLPPSDGIRYLVTTVGRYSRWPEATTLMDNPAASITRAFIQRTSIHFNPLHGALQSYRFTSIQNLCLPPGIEWSHRTFPLTAEGCTHVPQKSAMDGGSPLGSFGHPYCLMTQVVFIRQDGLRGWLQAPYVGPFPVLKCGDKYLTVCIKGKKVNISIDHLKPAYTLNIESQTQPANITRSGCRVRFPSYFQSSPQ